MNSWLRPLFASPLLKKLNFVATQEHAPLVGDTSILLEKQTLSRKHAFVVEVYLKEHLLWISDGSFTVSSVITEEAAQHLEQDSEYISVAQLRLGEIILRKFDLVLELFQSNCKPRIVIHQFYYKGEIFAPLENSLDLERDPTIGHLLDTFSKVVLGVDSYKREAVFLLSGLWKEAFESSRRWVRFATCHDIIKLGKFMETDSVQVENEEENSVPLSTPSHDEMVRETEQVASNEIKQECYEESNEEMVTMTPDVNIIGTSSQPNSQSIRSPQSLSPLIFQETNDVPKETQGDQSTKESWTQDAVDQLEAYERVVNEHISNGSSYCPTGKAYRIQQLHGHRLPRTFSMFRSELDIAPMDDILLQQYCPRKLEILKVISMDTSSGSIEPDPNEMKCDKKIYSVEELFEEREKWLRCSSIYSLVTPKKRKDTA
ncbi:hypothetical protein GpartN1_g2905.t1 [Galdieria partita]|uniref:Uncharacterized protein n=1 Tax=Galdieria partita TaxID=83374 RepID=A0A9C7PVA9_9RHOD|nr:hypothetical protein GpartN1_g2905.t1 [Galdieria partita]